MEVEQEEGILTTRGSVLVALDQPESLRPERRSLADLVDWVMWEQVCLVWLLYWG